MTLVADNRISDAYKLALDQWQRMTRAMYDDSYQDMMDAIRDLQDELDNLKLKVMLRGIYGE